MANKMLFKASPSGLLIPATDAVNEAGGSAYVQSTKHQLAQYAITGCLNNTYYVDAKMQLDKVLELVNGLELDFVAKVALYTRHKGFMKDMPALLTAILAVKGYEKLEFVFNSVIDNGKMLRNFMQIIRSGVLGRKSFGTRIKRLIKNWFNNAHDHKLLKAYVGQSPSLADMIKMAHPKAKDDKRNAFFQWVLGKEYNIEMLPQDLVDFEKWKAGVEDQCIPNVPFQMLTATQLTKMQWGGIAANAPWHMARMNLNTFLRHDVFDSKEITQLIVDKLKNRDEIKRSRVYPYQLMMAYLNVDDKMPHVIKEALQDALEIATDNVPEIPGNVVIGVDISGSMSSPVTGFRGRVTTKARYVDLASLFGACILRTNKTSALIPFHGDIVRCKINPRDSVMTNAQMLAKLCTNGTNVSSVLKFILGSRMLVDLVIIVSDSESWMDSESLGHVNYMYGYQNNGTTTMQYWNKIKELNPTAKLVCIDIAPNSSTQCVEREDIFNIGGFSDNLFDLVSDIAHDNCSKDYFVKTIDAVQLC